MESEDSGIKHRSTVKRPGMSPTIETRYVVVEELGDYSESSSATSEEEEQEERFWKKITKGPDAPAEYWYIQKLIKYIKGGNQNATIVALGALKEHDLSTKLNQMAIRDIGGLEVLVNLLDTSDDRCREGTLLVLQEISKNKTIQTMLTDQGIVSQLVKMLCIEPVSVQILAAEIIGNVCHIRRAGRIVRKFGGIARLVCMLDTTEKLLTTDRENFSRREMKRLRSVRGAANALGTLSQSSRNQDAMRNAGIIPLLSRLVKSVHQDILEPTMKTIQNCASKHAFQVGILYEGIIPDVLTHLNSENIKLKTHCATAIFKCAEDARVRTEVQNYNGLDTLLGLSQNESVQGNEILLAAVIGAIWKCALSPENVQHLNEINGVSALMYFIKNDSELVIAHAAGALAECAKDPENRQRIRNADGLQILTQLLSRPNPSLMHANVARALGECAKDLDSMDVLESLDTVRFIWTLLRSPDINVKCTAALALCPYINNSKDSGEMVRSLVGGLDLVTAQLNYNDPYLLACICNVITTIALDRENLAILTDHGIVQRLSDLLTTENDVLKEALSQAIGNCCNWASNAYEFGRLGVVELLVKHLSSSVVGIRRNATVALHQLSGDPFNCKIIHESGVVPVLITLTGSLDDMTQEAAAGCLANIRNLTFSLHEYKTYLRLKGKS